MVEGLANTGRVITSAAAIMVCVFTSFVLNGDPVVKEFGVGLAVAIAIDSTLVRCLLVPAVMVLLGKRAWWMPRWLRPHHPAHQHRGRGVLRPPRRRSPSESLRPCFRSTCPTPSPCCASSRCRSLWSPCLGETPNGDALAAAVFALAALTDGLDGYFARSRDAVTTFGKLMDPIADKLLIAAALVSLVSLDRVAAWVAMVIIAREFAVTVMRAIAAERGVVISASWLGKVKTGVQIAAVFALIAANPAPALGRPARLPRGGGDGDQRRRLLLRPAPPDRSRARSPQRGTKRTKLARSRFGIYAPWGVHKVASGEGG